MIESLPDMKPNNIYQQQQKPWEIVVISKDKKGHQMQATIQVTQYETMGSVRDKCARAHGLELNEFLLRIKQGL